MITFDFLLTSCTVVVVNSVGVAKNELSRSKKEQLYRNRLKSSKNSPQRFFSEKKRLFRNLLSFWLRLQVIIYCKSVLRESQKFWESRNLEWWFYHTWYLNSDNLFIDELFFWMILNFWGSQTTKLDKRQLNRSVFMSAPRENPRKILKKFSAYAILKESWK